MSIPPTYASATHAPNHAPPQPGASHPPAYSPYPIPGFEHSSINQALTFLQSRLAPRPPSKLSSSKKKNEYEILCRRLNDWCAHRRELYHTVYMRLSNEGRQVIYAELRRITNLSVEQLPTFAKERPRRDWPAERIHHDRVLYASDGTVVAFFRRLHHESEQYAAGSRAVSCYHEEALRCKVKLEGVMRTWLDEVEGCCPFWHAMYEEEQVAVVENLRRLVHSPPDEVFEEDAVWLNRFETAGQNYRERAAAVYRAQQHATAAQSLAHPLLGQPLTPRKARIYRML